MLIITVILPIAAYLIGYAIGATATDRVWRQWLQQQLTFTTQKIKVTDLYPEKKNE